MRKLNAGVLILINPLIDASAWVFTPQQWLGTFMFFGLVLLAILWLTCITIAYYRR